MVGLNLMIANITLNISGINTPLSNSIKENDQTIYFLKGNTLKIQKCRLVESKTKQKDISEKCRHAYTKNTVDILDIKTSCIIRDQEGHVIVKKKINSSRRLTNKKIQNTLSKN